MRTERDELAAHDPVALRAELEAAEAARATAEAEVARAEAAANEAAAVREQAAATEREVAEREAGVNKAWREASTELERLRETYEGDDRTRGDIERRIREAERLIREGYQADPDALVAELADDDSVEALEKRAELVQRRLALLGRVNLLATGEFEALQERHDFMARELDDVKKARRDLLEVIAQVDREITETFTQAYHDVAVQFERLIKELFPGGEGRLVLTDPAEPLTSGIEIEASPGRKRVKRISLLSGGERSLTAMAFLFAIFTARPSPFYLMDEVEPALDDVNLHRFLRLVEGFAQASQVLIVTHQKRTMEIAAMMYGISLNKDGTTKVVAQQHEHPTTLESDSRLEGAAARDAGLDRGRARHRGAAERAGRLASRSWTFYILIFGGLAVLAVVAFLTVRSTRRTRLRIARAGDAHRRRARAGPRPRAPGEAAARARSRGARPVGRRLPQGGPRRQGQGPVPRRRRRRDLEGARGPADPGRRGSQGRERPRGAHQGRLLERHRPGVAAACRRSWRCSATTDRWTCRRGARP